MRIREQLLRLNAELTGHRLLRGGVTLGGANLHTVPDPARLHAIADDLAEIIDLALGHTVVTDRFTGTAVLSQDAARDLGTLGYVARASGLPVDARYQHPLYEGFIPAVRDTGDVLARFLVRTDEIRAATALIAGLAPTITPGTTQAPRPTRPVSQPRSGVGTIEGWRGTITHRIELGPDGALTAQRSSTPPSSTGPPCPSPSPARSSPTSPSSTKASPLLRRQRPITHGRTCVRGGRHALRGVRKRPREHRKSNPAWAVVRILALCSNLWRRVEPSSDDLSMLLPAVAPMNDSPMENVVRALRDVRNNLSNMGSGPPPRFSGTTNAGQASRHRHSASCSTTPLSTT
jgi:hypothetical protein